LFHENYRPKTINTSSLVVFRMVGCNIIQDIPQASVSKKLECKIYAASCTICHAVSVIIQKLVGKGSNTPDGGITANKHPKARKKFKSRSPQLREKE
jgi:hypothetical protein